VQAILGISVLSWAVLVVSTLVWVVLLDGGEITGHTQHTSHPITHHPIVSTSSGGSQDSRLALSLAPMSNSHT
jgi:hypothetical protein